MSIEEESLFIRVATTYYKHVMTPLLSGDFIKGLRVWNMECIKQDYSKDYLAKIPKFDGFCVIPDHLNYRQVIGNFYNLYEKFQHQPKKGDCSKILLFLKHIFNDQVEYALDYIKILIEYPTQRLPVISLVSKQRNTGKTTFLMFLKAIFGNNMTINTNDDFRSNFNSEWTNKLLIGVDETFLDKKEDSERLKNLSTAKIFKAEAKGKDRIEIEFFSKFILCSNNEESFILIDPGETRYWVVKVNPLDSCNVNLLVELEKEIPSFLYFLLNRPFATKNDSRMWFNPKLLETPALRAVIRRSRNKIELEIISQMLFIIEEKELEEICFCINDVQEWLSRKGFKAVESLQIKRILQNDWKLEPSANSYAYVRYKYFSDGSIMEENAKGRYYKLDKQTVIKYNE